MLTGHGPGMGFAWPGCQCGVGGHLADLVWLPRGGDARGCCRAGRRGWWVVRRTSPVALGGLLKRWARDGSAFDPYPPRGRLDSLPRIGAMLGTPQRRSDHGCSAGATSATAAGVRPDYPHAEAAGVGQDRRVGRRRTHSAAEHVAAASAGLPGTRCLEFGRPAGRPPRYGDDQRTTTASITHPVCPLLQRRQCIRSCRERRIRSNYSRLSYSGLAERKGPRKSMKRELVSGSVWLQPPRLSFPKLSIMKVHARSSIRSTGFRKFGFSIPSCRLRGIGHRGAGVGGYRVDGWFGLGWQRSGGGIGTSGPGRVYCDGRAVGGGAPVGGGRPGTGDRPRRRQTGEQGVAAQVTVRRRRGSRARGLSREACKSGVCQDRPA